MTILSHSPPQRLWLFVAVACLVFMPLTEASKNLMDWIVEQGGEYNEKQQTGKNGGMVATQDIARGEVLVKVPWNIILGAKGATPQVLEAEARERDHFGQFEEEGYYMGAQCRLIRDIYQEIQQNGKDSAFFAHLEYLSLLTKETSSSTSSLAQQIPAMWSQEARDLLEDINDHGALPPAGLFTTLNHDWYGACIQDIEHDKLEKAVAATVAAHGSLGHFGLLVPLLDQYDRVPHESGTFNVVAQVDIGNSVSLVAIQTIKMGEPILRAYDESHRNEAVWALDMFVESGILDDEHYPKFYNLEYRSSTHEFPFDLEVYKDNGELGVAVLEASDGHDEDLVEEFCARHINKLKRIESLVLAATGDDIPQGISRTEWETIWKYHASLLQALELALESLTENQEESCPGGQYPSENGSCPLWDGLEALPNEAIWTDVEFDETNPYGPTEAAYSMCNDLQEWEGYVQPGDLEVLKSQYQEIRFFWHPKTEDMGMRLDGTVQQLSSYRPHYHEFAVHFPARFLENVENILFVGGGDSMVLHEALKYPSLKKVVGLELDQYVLRNSFRYFNTQPHFDDKRVEWWFGDGAKSLLMLPKDYYQSFDLVVVDLSETVMSFQVTSQLSIFQTLSLLLKPDGILLKNGEYYMEKMSNYFDHTLQYFEYDVPFICDQGMVIGSNKIDFYNRTMKDHGVELLVLESQEEINEKFDEYYRFTEYRKNDARKQGQCENVEYDESGIKNAGILMVVEAENVKHDLKSFDAVEKTIGETLKSVGFSIESTVKHEPSTLVFLTKEGYITARLHPEKSYVGLDIKLWANFDLMEPAREALVQSLGGSEEGTSSFRIVTGGMSGSPFEELDRSKIGPRMVNNRNCEMPQTPASDDKIVDLKESGLESSLGMVEDGVIAAVVCGSKDQACESLERLKKAPQSKLKKILPVYTCESMSSKDAEFSPHLDTKMARCEVELSDALGSAGDKISLLVVDDSANHITGKVLLSLFTSVWNRKRLFSQHRFIALVENNTAAWHRNLLLLIREKIVYKPMSLVDLVLENSKEKSKLSMLSLHDEKFFLHLKETLEAFDQTHGESTSINVDKIFDGLPAPQIGHFNPKKFHANDYDPVPAKEQRAGQTSMARQSMVQFEITQKNPKITVSDIESALSSAIIAQGEIKFTSFEGNASIGDGLVVVAFSEDGATQAILSWDGKTHIDANLYSIDENPQLRTSFINVFVNTLGRTTPVKVTLSDTHPRGVGRVVSFPGHMN